MSNLTGFNPQVVTQALSYVHTAYNDVVHAFGVQMQKDVVGFMSDKWACNLAIEAFGEIKKDVDGLMVNVDNIFSSIVDSMNSAAARWAEQTKTSWSGGSKLSPYNLKLDISSIHENIGGVRGIDEDDTPGVYDNLSNIQEQSLSALDKAVDAVAASGFFDNTDMQQSSLDSSLNTIRNNINTAVTNVTSSLQQYIAQTLADFGNSKVKYLEHSLDQTKIKNRYKLYMYLYSFYFEK